MKKYTIRKISCGHWIIILMSVSGVFISFKEIAHLETFGDVLVFMDVPVNA